MNALRELAESWRANADSYSMPTSNENRGYGNALCICADELLSILDAGGDADARDAERYRWILQNVQTIEGRKDWYWWADDDEVTPLSERIDAAIQGETHED